MAGERDTSRQMGEASLKRKRHKHLSKGRSPSRSRSEKRHSKKQKRRRQTSCESSSMSSRSVSPAHKKRKKCKDKKTKRHSDKQKKKKHHHHHHHKKVKDTKPKVSRETAEEVSAIGPVAPGNNGPKNCTKTTDSGSRNAESTGKTMKPMTKEEWEKKQSEVRRVYDPETGRHRLVRGEGEIIEEIVSRDRHKEINKIATRGDGLFYQLQAGLAKQH